jgi:hypothetical protein
VADVFVSYQRQDQARVKLVVQKLREAGLAVWWDQDIPPGAPWEGTIEAELHAAKAVIVAWSPAAVASDNVKAEARRARNAGKLIQIFVGLCEPPLFFGEHQGVDLVKWKGAASDPGFQTVVAAARAVTEGQRPPQGVGYAPWRRTRRWSLVATSAAATLAIIASSTGARSVLCRMSGLGHVCQSLGLIHPAAASAGAAPSQLRQAVLQTLAGAWDLPARNCGRPIAISVATDGTGISRVTVTSAGGRPSVGQVSAVDNGVVETRETTPGPSGAREVWEYRPNGDQLSVIDKDGVTTNLVRCRKSPAATAG